jgi:CubicO group peptidase (beta-lactamase class C family)
MHRRRSRPCTGRVSLLLGLLLFAAAPALAAAQPAPLRGLDAYVERAMRDWEVPGLAIAVVRGDSVVFARGYGVRELGRPERVDAHTLFAVASTTKAMTAAALGMLVDQQRIGWDDPVARHFPVLQLHDPYVTRELTVRDLLTHRSGLPRGDLLWWAAPHSRTEVLQRVRHLRPASSFRARYGYQNIMYLAAGELLAGVSGQSWDDFLAEHLFRPLGMNRSNTSVARLAGMGNVATPHARIDDQVRPVAWRSFDNVGAAGAVNSSAWEMAQWIRLNLNHGTFAGRRLLSEATIREMQTPQTVIRADTLAERLYPEVNFRAYGLGWVLQDYRGRKMVHHGGALDGMRTHLAMIPSERLGVVVIANMEPTTLHVALAYRVLDAYLDGRRRDWSRDLLAVAERQRREAAERDRQRREARVVDTRPSLPLERYAGAYTDSLYGEVRVAQEDGRLVLRFGSSYTGDLEHWHFDTFRVTWRDAVMGRTTATFTLNGSGAVRSLCVEDFAEFRRQEDDAKRVAAGG